MAAMMRLRSSWAEWQALWASGQARAAVWWTCRRISRLMVRRLGWSGLLLLTLLMVILAALWASAWQRSDMLRIGEQAVRTRSAESAVQDAQLAKPSQARLQMQSFVDGLPVPSHSAVVVQSLLSLAAEHGLSLPKGAYQFQALGQGQVASYRMATPVQGSGTQVRRFIAAALQAHPSLAIDGLRLSREDTSSVAVEARIDWVLYTRPSTEWQHDGASR